MTGRSKSIKVVLLTFTMVTDLNKAGSMLQKKQRSVTYVNGILTSLGPESGWIDVGEFGGSGYGYGSGAY